LNEQLQSDQCSQHLRSILKEGVFAVVESSDISTLAFESTSTSKTPSSELTEIKILFGF
jgi:hypothetical protein